MFLVNNAMIDLNLGTAGLVALLGYLVVFVGLISLMVVVYVVGKIMVSSKQKTAAPAPAPAAAAPTPVRTAAPAPGSAGEVKLHNVGDREAAILMAIVANRLGKPLNELRFKSIKEVS